MPDNGAVGSANAPIDEQWVTKALAPRDELFETLALARVLTIQSPEDWHLTTLATNLKCSGEHLAFEDVYQQLLTDLQTAEKEMRDVNKRNQTDYHYLYPSEIPASTSV